MDTDIGSTAKAISNLERLQAHLKKGSLASKLVVAGIAAGENPPQAELQQVILDHLGELKRKHEPGTNK